MRPNQHSHGPKCAREHRQRYLEAGRNLDPCSQDSDLPALVSEVQSCCGASMLKAHRLARGWTAQRAVDEFHAMCRMAGLGTRRLSREQLSHFENGPRPGEEYRDLLCRLYTTGPIQMGWAADYSRTSNPSPPVNTRKTAGARAVSPGLLIAGIHEEGDVKRRELLQLIFAASGAPLTSGLLDTADQLRAGMDDALVSASINSTSLDRWEAATEALGSAFKTRPPRELLDDLFTQFAEAQYHASRRQPVDYQQRLCLISARVAGVIGNVLTDLGHHRYARSWFGTAQIAADETGQRDVRAWTRAREAVVSLYHHRPPQIAVNLAREARQVAGAGPCAATALAAATEARALARLGARNEALAALHTAERAFDRLGPEQTADSIYGYPVQQLAYHREAVLTAVGATTDARRAQREALSLYPPTQHVIPTLIRLDEAACLLRDRDVSVGCNAAQAALQEAPAGYLTALVLSRAHELTDLIPAAARRTPAAQGLRDALAEGQLSGQPSSR